jgi:hypothetical protein
VRETGDSQRHLEGRKFFPVNTHSFGVEDLFWNHELKTLARYTTESQEIFPRTKPFSRQPGSRRAFLGSESGSTGGARTIVDTIALHQPNFDLVATGVTIGNKVKWNVSSRNRLLVVHFLRAKQANALRRLLRYQGIQKTKMLLFR